MPGHMGNARITVQNLKVVAVREPDNVLLIQGAVPGYSDNYLVIKKALKREPKVPSVKPPSGKPKQEKKAKPSVKPQSAKK